MKKLDQEKWEIAQNLFETKDANFLRYMKAEMSDLIENKKLFYLTKISGSFIFPLIVLMGFFIWLSFHLNSGKIGTIIFFLLVLVVYIFGGFKNRLVNYFLKKKEPLFQYYEDLLKEQEDFKQKTIEINEIERIKKEYCKES